MPPPRKVSCLVVVLSLHKCIGPAARSGQASSFAAFDSHLVLPLCVQVNECTTELKANLQEEHLAGMEFIGTVFKTILTPLQKARAIVQSYPFYPDVYQVRMSSSLPHTNNLCAAQTCVNELHRVPCRLTAEQPRHEAAAELLHCFCHSLTSIADCNCFGAGEGWFCSPGKPGDCGRARRPHDLDPYSLQALERFHHPGRPLAASEPICFTGSHVCGIPPAHTA